MTTTSEHPANGHRPAGRGSFGEYFADLDPHGPVPLHAQVSERLEQAIRDGAIAVGERLESETALAQRLGISRATAQRSIRSLVDRGLLVRRRGIGTQVLQSRAPRPLELTALDDPGDADRESGDRILVHEVIPASAGIAARLRIREGADVLYMRRLRHSNGRPAAIVDGYLPTALADGGVGEPDTRSLSALLRELGVAIRSTELSVGARLALADDVELLGITVGDPLLTVDRCILGAPGGVLGYGSECYLPDLYAVQAMLVGR
ncbi:GntR family transcriptional regulator [Rothia sp. AR01]|uniref:GntR family transcriptional regulator n=1 Tax=Rothia santali TaxID=2949643 RepID=A0A9X2HJP3_9MICC|nr:GntR family transcriptional regulator [Rothia santali]MCP3425503.1 GntR family transcriptional regulator [Rothia santali]